MALGLTAAPALDPAAQAAVADLLLLPDEQLLTRFFKQHEDGAFAAIVKRHGPVVYGVCRRILSDSNDAEDAFQATFLVLVRKGASLRQPGKLSSWLYGVANRTARKVKLQAALRKSCESRAPRPLPSDPGELKYDELRSILDEEIGQLPEKYALPLVLCYLEGKTNAQAAEQLGWPEGSMSRRLSRGRELLRKRLMRRGLALTAALIAAVFCKQTLAAVPAALAEATAIAGQKLLAGAKLREVASPAAAKAVLAVLESMTAAVRLTGASLLAAASILLALTTAIYTFTRPAYGASSYGFGNGDWFQGLVTNSSDRSTRYVFPTVAPASGGCGGAVVAPSCGDSSCAPPTAHSTPPL
ncbi:MAG TPA: sigma-70 family RNA polymerase sigma factor [Pirellulaceae bacterium]|nr:sigma-70 family RNA polymerase sigma factor [Pirellulaceae bacterium]